MKTKSLIILTVVAALCVSAASLLYAGTKVGPITSNGASAGYRIGSTTSEKVGFFGATPVVQPTASSTSRGAMQTLGLLASDGTITATATGTGSTSTVTLSKNVGTISSGAITTAAGATHTMTVTNTLVTASSIILASVDANTSGGTPVITSITPGSGSFTVQVQNIHATAPFDHAIKINFMIAK